MAKDEVYIKQIHTNRWLRLRLAVLSAHPLCQRCEEEGRVSAATEVHHIRPVEEGTNGREKERLMFDPHNLRALCHNCHVLTHTEMGRSGRKANTERKARQAQEVCQRFFR